ncbi:MAG: hypothetical protein KKD31_15285, partial [Bacteroidetes bacterium]|nr:hypothetical protein [Bacteroidota bacterium]
MMNNGAGVLSWSGAEGLGAWTTTGNTLTGALPDTPNEWIGTINGADWIIKTNNTERVRILSAGNILFSRTTALFATDLFEAQGSAAFPDAINGYTDQAGGFGVFGENTSAAVTSGAGVSGYADGGVNAVGAQGGTTVGTGVFGYGSDAAGIGIFASNTAANGAGTGIALFARSNQTGASTIIAGLQTSSFFSGAAISAVTANTIADGTGLIADCSNATGVGVQGQSTGSSGIGVFGIGTGTSGLGVIGIATNESTLGTGYYYGETNAIGVWGDATGANNTNEIYHFGVHGTMWVNATTSNRAQRTGGVLGSHEDNDSYHAFGILAYNNSAGTKYGVYYSTAGTGTGAGFMQNGNIQTGIGIGGVGGVMGGWSKGEVLGFTSCGVLYASYNLGNEYTSGYQVEIVNSNGNRVAAYTNTSMDVKIYNDGIAQLTNGKGTVGFDDAFRALLSAEGIPTITVTPQGKCNGLYIENIDKNGFTVAELGDGNSNVKFSWIVISRRVDANNKPDLPQDIQANDFDEKMKGVMFNESDREHSALPIWWDGSKLRFDEFEGQENGTVKKNARKNYLQMKTPTQHPLMKKAVTVKSSGASLKQ